MSRNKRVTIADVARTANVSRALVSFVLNGRLKDVAPATRIRIQQAIDELGYRPNAIARNLATKRAGAIGIVCDMDMGSFFSMSESPIDPSPTCSKWGFRLPACGTTTWIQSSRRESKNLPSTWNHAVISGQFAFAGHLTNCL